MATHPRSDDTEDLHGIEMSERDFEILINSDPEFHYEWHDGIVYNMSGCSPEHSDITSNITESLRIQFGKTGPCRVYQEQYVQIPGQRAPVSPDVVLTCNIADRDKKQRLKPFRVTSPLIVVEVLSPS